MSQLECESEIMTEIRGIMLPRRSHWSRGRKGHETTAAPPDPEEQQQRLEEMTPEIASNLEQRNNLCYEIMPEIRGIMPPRISHWSRSRKGHETTAPPDPEEQQRQRGNDTEIATSLKQRNDLSSSGSSGICFPEPDLKIIPTSGHQTKQPPNPDAKIQTPTKTTSPPPSRSNLKAGLNLTKHVGSPNGSPKQKFGSSQSNAPIILHKIYREIAFHRQGNSSITSYFTKLKELWDQLAKAYNDLAPQYSSDAINMLSEHMEREKVIQFLVGLNDSYSSTCSKILFMRPFPTVDTAFSVIIRKENRRKLVALSQYNDEEND